jgi:PTS system nitrogen regulatory IIA component
MTIPELITPDRTLCGIEGVSKKRTLEILANAIARDIPSINADEVFRRLVARERLGSTAIGFGIALPHCRMEYGSQATGALITLKQPIEFDAIDGQKVDILFAMLVPENANAEHLDTLSSLARSLNDAGFRESLRQADSDQALFQAAIS